MSTEVGPLVTVVNPITGEVLTADSPTSDLGRLLERHARLAERDRRVTVSRS